MEAYDAQPSTLENSRDVMLRLFDESIATLAIVEFEVTHVKPTPARKAEILKQLAGVVADVQKIALALK